MHFFCMYGHNYQYLIFLGAEKPAPKVLPALQKKVASNMAATDHEKHQPDGKF